MNEEREDGAGADPRPQSSLARLRDEGAVVLSYLGGRDLAHALTAWPRAQVQRAVQNALHQGGTVSALALALPHLPRAPMPRSALWLLTSIGHGYRQGHYLNPVYRVAIETHGFFSSTAAHWAASNNRPDLILAMARSGASPAVLMLRDAQGHTPAEIASLFGLAAVTRALLQAEVPAAAFIASSHAHPLGSAGLAVQENHVEVLEEMNQGGVDLTARDEATGENLLDHAVMGNRPHVIGALIRACTQRGVTFAALLATNLNRPNAVCLAVALDRRKVIRALHRAGVTHAQLLIEGPEGTCLHVAARLGRAGMVATLAEIGVNLNVTYEGWAAIHVAATHDHAGVIGALFPAGGRAGAFPDAVGPGGVTAAHIAAERGHRGAMDALRSMGANFDLPRHVDGRTARALATERGLAGHLPPVPGLGGAGSESRCTIG